MKIFNSELKQLEQLSELTFEKHHFSYWVRTGGLHAWKSEPLFNGMRLYLYWQPGSSRVEIHLCLTYFDGVEILFILSRSQVRFLSEATFDIILAVLLKNWRNEIF